MWWLFLVGIAQADRPAYTEEEMTEVTAQVLDVLPWHQYVLRTQLLTDKPGNFVELAMFGSPSRFELPSTELRDGTLIRFGIGAGLGFGKPATGFAAFAGLQVDYGMAQGTPTFSSEGTIGLAAGGIVYGGASFKGWTLTAAALPVQPFSWSADVDPAAEPTPEVRVDAAYTLYQQEGVSVGAVRGQDLSGDAVLAALHGMIRPEKALERAGARRFGVFGLGLTRFGEGLDPYRERGGREALPAVYETALSGDDLGESGVRVVVTPQVAPVPTLRRAQVGFLYDEHPDVLAGGQAGVLNRGGQIQPSIQVYGAFRPEWFRYFSLYGVPRIAVSYSYNVPDPIAFFTVDQAHVFGIQYIYGREEFARPLIPVYRTTDELEERGPDAR